MTRTEQLRSVTNEIKAAGPKKFSPVVDISHKEYPKFRQIYENLNTVADWEEFLYKYILALEKRIEELENR